MVEGVIFIILLLLLLAVLEMELLVVIVLLGELVILNAIVDTPDRDGWVVEED